MASYDYTFKIMVLGDADTPKTSLIIRYISGFYLEDLKLTIGVDFYSKTTLYKGKKVKLQIWDFGGEERFRFLLHQYCKGVNAALFLYNIRNPSTLDHLPDWIQIIREHSGDIPIILVGAKAHLEQSRVVSKEEGILAAQKYNLSGFIEVSSKTGQNIEETFEALTRLILADNSKGRKKRKLKNAVRSQFLEKVSVKGDMDRLLDDFQIPEEVKKEKQPRITDEDIMILDLESEEGIQLIKLFEEAIGVHATERGKETKLFIKWLKGEEVFVRKRFPRARGNMRGRDDDRYPYPYVFKPPEPPDDIVVAPGMQLHTSPKKKVPEEKIHCQYCGIKLAKDEQLTHSCKKKPKNT